jgi:hypothetical protein
MRLIVYFPTVLWLAGFVEFNGLVLAGPRPRTWGLGPLLAVLVLIVTGLRRREPLRDRLAEALEEVRAAPRLFRLLFLSVGALIALAGLEARHPPHLTREFDAFNYHMALPRQHLLGGTLGHIPWSTADLWPMPVQFGFASAWFCGDVLHKLPQYACQMWLFLLLISLGRLKTWGLPPSERWRGWIPAFACFGAHGVGIQLGTAMMDLPNLYFMAAALHAFSTGSVAWGATQLAISASAKSFAPLQTVAVLALAGLITWLGQRAALSTAVRRVWRAAAITTAVATLLLARSAWIGTARAGTPLFPFAACSIPVGGCDGPSGEEVRRVARLQLDTRNAYGEGRGPLALARHVWEVAVPAAGRVDNSFDYPLGLPWLLGILLMAFGAPSWLRARRVPFAAALALSFWATWWLGSQQSRFLYPALALFWLATIDVQRRVGAPILLGSLLVSTAFSGVSQWRCERACVLGNPSNIQAALERHAREDASDGSPRSLGSSLYQSGLIEWHGSRQEYWVFAKPSQHAGR